MLIVLICKNLSPEICVIGISNVVKLFPILKNPQAQP